MKYGINRGARIKPEVAGEILDSLRVWPELLDPDRFVLAVIALQRMSERRLLPRNVALGAEMTRGVVLAVDATMRALNAPWQMSILKDALRGYMRWSRWVERLAVDLANGADLGQREQTVARLWIGFRRELGVPRLWEQFRYAAKKGAALLDTPEDDEPVETLLTFKHLNARGRTTGMFVGNDGVMRLGYRNVRDVMAKGLGAKRIDVVTKTRPKTVSLDKNQASSLEAVMAVEAVDAVRRVDEFIEQELAKVSRRSPAAAVLLNLPRLIDPDADFSTRELARETGFPPRTLDRQRDRYVLALKRFMGAA